MSFSFRSWTWAASCVDSEGLDCVGGSVGTGGGAGSRTT